MNMRKGVLILALLIGAVMLVVAMIVYVRYQTFGYGGTVLSVLGVVLMGMSVWNSIKVSVGPTGGIQAEFLQTIEQRLESVETEQGQVGSRVANVEKAAQEVRKDFAELNDRFFVAIDAVRDLEDTLPESEKQKRQTVYERFASHIDRLPPKYRLKQQEYFTRMHLRTLEIDIPKLKTMLKEVEYYDGKIDEVFDASLAEAIKNFQRDQRLRPVDGIFGRNTYQALAKKVGR